MKTTNNQLKITWLSLLAMFLLISIVGCSKNDEETNQVAKNVVDEQPEEQVEKSSNEEINEKITVERQLENDILQALGFSEEKDDIVRLGSDDEGSDDQSVTVNEKEGSSDLFMSVSKESTGIDTAGDGPMVGLVISHDLKREKESIEKLEKVSKELIEIISSYEYVDWIGIDHNLLTGDDYSRALSINIERATLDEIEWNSLQSNELESIADGYHLKEDLK